MHHRVDHVKKTMYAVKQHPDHHRQFEQLEASSLFCGKCRQAVPVRKKLLLVLPDGEKYDYLCAHCGTPVGSKVSRDETPPVRIMP